MSAFEVTLAVLGGVVSLGAIGGGFYRLSVWISRLNGGMRQLNDLVQHELRPNSGSSIKDHQGKQTQALKAIQDRLAEDRKEDLEWQQGVMMTLGNHDARIDRLEKE